MVSDIAYSDAAKKARREYKKKWNKMNADKVRAAQRRYWEKKAREAIDAQREEHTIQDGRDTAVPEH